MILRKPYAFFIKNFKIFHLIMMVLFVYLVYKSSALNAFLNNYISTTNNVLGQDLSSIYFSDAMFFIPFILITVSIIIGGVMLLKRKTITLYVINIIVNIATLVIYNIALSTLTTMEYKMVAVKELRALNDITLLLFLFQIAMTVIMLVRGTGFDIKKFDFAKDLQELKIEDTDYEEVEVGLNVNTRKVKRNIKQKIRFAKYFYLEHKFIINIIVVLTITVFSFTTFYDKLVLNKSYSQNVNFILSGYNMVIENAYITNKDYEGNVIDKYSKFIIIESSIKSNIRSKKIDIARISLLINNKHYYVNTTYNSKFSDIGTGYMNELISNKDYEKYLFIFQVPNDADIIKTKFSYVDKLVTNSFNPKYIKVNLKLNKINENSKTYKYNLNEELSFENSVLDYEKLTISSFDIQNEYKEKYNFILNNKTYKSYEYIKKSIETYETRAILKIKSTYDIYELLSKYGEISYTKNGIQEIDNLQIKEIKPTKYIPTNTYYYEVSNKLLNADSINLVFNIRNKTYIYNLKGGIS